MGPHRVCVTDRWWDAVQAHSQSMQYCRAPRASSFTTWLSTSIQVRDDGRHHRMHCMARRTEPTFTAEGRAHSVHAAAALPLAPWHVHTHAWRAAVMQPGPALLTGWPLVCSQMLLLGARCSWRWTRQAQRARWRGCNGAA